MPSNQHDWWGLEINTGCTEGPLNYAMRTTFMTTRKTLLSVLIGAFVCLESAGQFTFSPSDSYLLTTLCQGQSIDHCISVSSAGNNHSIQSFSGNDGNIIVAPPTSPFDTCFRYTASFSYTGFDTVTFVINNNLGQTDQLNIVFKVVNPNNPTNGGPNQQLCEVNTTTLSAISPDPLATGFWTVIGGSGTLVTPNSPTTVVNNLSLGTNSFLWNQNYPCDANIDLVQVFRYTGTPPIANAGPDVSLCSGNTYVMQANSAGVSATGTWEITCGNATIFNINSATALVTNLGLGVNCFEWNISNGPCPGGDTEDQMFIYVFNSNHPAANAGPDQNLCSSGPVSITLSANAAQIPATSLWSQVSGPAGAAIVSPTNPTTNVTGLIPGQYVFQYTINNGGCGTLTDQVVVNIFNPTQPAANAGSDQELCLPNNSTVLAANSITFPGTGTWTVISGTGSFANANSPTTAVTGLSTGVNIFRWTFSNGTCSPPVTFDDVSITVFPTEQPATNAGSDLTLCFNGTPVSVTMAASNVNPPGFGLWTQVSGPSTASFSSTSSPTAVVSNLVTGQYVLQWTVSNAPCPGGGTDQMTITVFNNGLNTINAGPDGSLCTPSNTFTMAATAPPFPATGSWTLISGSGVIGNPLSPTTTITNLGAGNNVFRWTLNNGPCASSVFDDVIISLFNNTQAAANAGPDLETCYSGTLPATVTMAANAAGSPAAGTWTLVSSSGTPNPEITSPNNPVTTVTNLFPGTYTLQWAINNGACGSTSDQITITVYSPNQSNADAGSDQQVCSTSPSVTLAAGALTLPASGQWSVIAGTGTFANPTSPSTIVTGMSLGINTYLWTIDNGPCAVPAVLSDPVNVTVFSAAQAAANAGPDVTICSTTNTVTLSANAPLLPATGMWTVISGTGIFSNPASPATSVSGMSVGCNVYQWSINNGPCGGISNDQLSICVNDINAPAADAGDDTDQCVPNTSITLNGNTPVFPATGEWTLVSGSGTIVNPASPSATVTGLGLGSNIFAWTINNGACNQVSSDQVVITLFANDLTGADAGDDAVLCTPTSTYQLQAAPVVLPGYGQWSLMAGSGTISDVSDPNATVTGLTIGENVFRWTIFNGPCPGGSDFDEVSVFVFNQNQTQAAAGPDQQFCFDGITPVNATMAGSAVTFPGTGTWTVVSGGGTIADPSNATTLITGIPTGVNVYQWTTNNGPCSGGPTSDQVTVIVYAASQSVSTAGPDQQICSTAPSVTLAANNVNLPALGTWTVLQGTGTFSNINNPGATVTGLSIGNNVFQWNVDNGVCSTPASDQVTITVYNAAQAAANAGNDISICSDQASVALSGNNFAFPATGAWTLISGSGVFSDAANNSTQVTGYSIGLNQYQYTIFNGPCTASTSDIVSLTIFDDNQPAASAGADLTVCTPVSSIMLTGNPVSLPATGTWSLISGCGIVDSPNTNMTAVSGLCPGVSVFRWTINNAPCSPVSTFDDVSIFVYDENQPPASAGPDQEYCEPVSSAVLAANTPVFPATGQWSLVSGSGTFTDSNNPLTAVTNLSQGLNQFAWTLTNGPCANSITSDVVDIYIYENTQPAADAGDDQVLCSPANSTFLSANAAVFPATGTWSVVNGSGIFVNPNDPNTQVLGLSNTENIFQWTIDNTPCANGLTSDQVSVFVYTSNAPSAAAGPDLSVCTPQDQVTMAANAPVFPATGSWILLNGQGTIQDPNDPNTLITNLGVGENIFAWSIDNGGCGAGYTLDEISIFVYSADAPDANAGEDQDLCLPETSAVLEANDPVFPGFGAWTLLSGSGTISDTGNPLATVTGLAVGENIFQWTLYNGPCPNAVTSDIVVIRVFNAGGPPANAGPDQALCSPDFDTAMDADPAVFPGSGTWTVVSGSGTFLDPSNPTSVCEGLAIGHNVFQWTLDYSACGTQSDLVEITVYNSAQGAADAGDDQAFCTPESTTALQATAVLPPGFGTWSVIEGDGEVDNVNDPNSNVNNLSQGNNTLVWTVFNGPCLLEPLTTDTVRILLYDNTQAAANAGPDQFYCTPISLTTLTGNGFIYPATGIWQLVSGSGTLVSPSNPNCIVSGLGIGENIFTWTIFNGPCDPAFTVDTVSVFIFDGSQPAAEAGPDQSLCWPESSAQLDANAVTFPGSGTWTVLAGSGVLANAGDPDSEVSGLSLGENVLQWQVSNGPCGVSTSTVSIFVYDNLQSNANAGPNQEFCLPDNSAVMAASSYTFPGTGAWSVVSGAGTFANLSSPTSTVSNLGAGENIFLWTVFNGPCVNSTTTDQVSVFIYDDNADIADAGEDQSYCEPVNSTLLAAAVPDAPGYGTWSVISSPGTVEFSDASSPQSEVTGLIAGETQLLWTVYNGPCSNTNTTDVVSIFIYDAQQESADAGPDQSFCTPINSSVLSASVPEFPSFGYWTVAAGTADITDVTDPNSPVTGLGVGTVVLSWNISNGPCDPPFTSDDVVITIYDGTLPASNAGSDQELCLPNTTTNLSASPASGDAGTGTWTVIQGSAVFDNANDAATAVTGLSQGINVLAWTFDNGPCGSTTDQVVISVFSDDNTPADAGADISICTPQGCVVLAANTPEVPALGAWSILSGPGTLSDTSDPEATLCGLGVGETVLLWSIFNGPCAASVTTDTVSVFVFDQFMASADAGSDQELCLPTTSAFLNAVAPVFPASGTWSLVSGCGDIAEPNNPQSAVTGLCAGVNVFAWTVLNGPCSNSSSSDLVQIILYTDEGTTADAGEDQSWCLPLSSTFLSAEAPQFPATGSWQLLQGTGAVSEPGNPLSQVTGLGPGENIFAWTVYNGPCSNTYSVDLVSIFIYNNAQPAANAGADLAFCVPANAQTQMNGNAALLPAFGEWTLVSGGGNIANPSDPQTIIADIPPGCSSFAWTIYNGGCTPAVTSDTITVCVYTSTLGNADAGPDQTWCLPNNTVTMAANALSGAASGFWTLLSGSGAITDPGSPTTTITDLQPGISTFQWTFNNGPCGLTTDQVTILIYDPSAPPAYAGEDGIFCSPVSSYTMNANTPAVPGTGTWITITSGVVEQPNNPNSPVSALTVGENIFMWCIDNGPCAPPTCDIMSIFIYNNLTPPADAGDDQEVCLPQTTALLNASPAEFPAIGFWSLLSGEGVISDVNSSNTTITGLSEGTHCFVWTVFNGPCDPSLSADTVCVDVFNPDQVPYAGEDLLLCTPTGSIMTAANAAEYPAYGFWTLLQGSATIEDVNDPMTAITDLAVGINVFTWSFYVGGCEDGLPSDTLIISLYDQGQPAAYAGVDQQICLPENATTLDGNELTLPATGQWTVLEGSGNFSDDADPNTVVTGLAEGTNRFVWTLFNGPCDNAITSDTVSVLVFPSEAQLSVAGPPQELCTPQNCTTMAATPVTDPAVGTWEIISGNASISDFHDPAASVCDLIVGETVLQWTVYNGPCADTSFSAITISVFNATADSASAGEDIELCAPESATVITANAPVFPAWGQWSVVSGSCVLDDPNSPTTLVSGLSTGVVTLAWYLYNGACGESSDTLNITVFDPTSQNAYAGEDLYYCDPPQTVQLAGNAPIFPAFGTWTQIAGDTLVTFTDIHDPQAVTSAPALNESAFVWTLYNGSCDNGLTSDTLWIYVNSSAVANANAGADQAYCGAQDIIQLSGSTPIGLAVGTWSALTGDADFTDPNEQATTVLDLPLGINTLLWTVDNGVCGVTSDSVDIVFYDPGLPPAYAGPDLVICEHEFSTFNLMGSEADLPATGWWTVLEGPVIVDDSTAANSDVLSLGNIITPLVDVPSVLTWTVDNGLCGMSSDTVIFILEDCLTIVVPDAFSPNGDGTNDNLVIPNIESYPNSSFEVFNRWGMKIFEASPYNNTWDGTSLHSATVGDPLPVSTYYYVLDLGTGEEAFHGFIYLKR